MSRRWSGMLAAGSAVVVMLILGAATVESETEGKRRPNGRALQGPVTWPDEVSGKNFPLLALLDADQAAHRAVVGSPELRLLLDEKRTAVAKAVETCGERASCHADALVWSAEDITRAREALVGLVRSGAATSLIQTMRRTGLFARDATLTDEALLVRSWERTADGLNHVLAVYGHGKAPRYPAIDSVSHDVTSTPYGRMVHTSITVMAEKGSAWDAWYQPTRDFALRLLDLNWRDEAGRHEPLHRGENAAAFTRASTLRWSDYPYTAALVPGSGLTDQMEREHHALNPMGKLIVEIAAQRYHDRKVPFIIVSGGYVHPKHSRFAEAVEMKRALVRHFQVPENAIIIDPHARHTTTNVRNAARLMLRYGFPADRPALIATQQYHLDYIDATTFDQRNERELGYLPYLSRRRLSRFELEWFPNPLALHADPLDPLDP